MSRRLRRRPLGSLSTRLVGSFLTLALVSVAVVGAGVYFLARSALRESVRTRLADAAGIHHRDLDRWTSDRTRDVERLAQDPLVARAARALIADSAAPAGPVTVDLAERIASVGPEPAVFSEVFVMAPVGGRIVFSTRRESVGQYAVSDRFFSEGRDRTTVQPLYPSSLTGRPTMTVATPIRSPSSDELIAVLGVHLNLDFMDSMLQLGQDLAERAEMYLVSEYNDFVSADRFGREAFRRGVHTDGIDAALRGETGVGLYENYDGVPVIGSYQWIPALRLALLAEMPLTNADGPARQLLGTILLLGFVATLILSVGTWFIARGIVRPIGVLRDSAGRVASGDLDTEAAVPGTNELAELATAFNHMTSQLRNSYRDLKAQVTATTEALDTLAVNQRLLESIMANAPAAIAVSDPSGTLLTANERFEDLCAVEHGEATGRRAQEILPGPLAERFETALPEALSGGSVVEVEVNTHQAAAEQYFLVTFFPLLGPAGTPYAMGMTATDWTERKHAEEAQARLQEQLQHAQKLESLGVLAGGIAHDFNNILTAIVGNTELAASRLGHGLASREYLDRVLSASHRAAALTQQMLAYAGKASLGVHVFDLNQLVEDIAPLAEIADSKKVTFEYDLAPTPMYVQADQTQISQVVLNLVTNGVEAIGGASGTVRVVTSSTSVAEAGLIADDLEVEDHDEFVSLRISDTGRGMDRKTRDRMFDPFFSTKGTGRGLGLSAVLGIVKGSGGAMSIDSEVGRGTRVDLVFPLVPAPTSDEPEGGSPRPDVRRGLRLVLADDEKDVRDVLKEALRLHGFEVVTAADGQEALECVQRMAGDLDAVVLDLTMPRLNGHEVLERIRAMDRSIPVLLMSGFDEGEAVRHVHDRAHVRFLAKPFPVDTLVDQLVAMVESEQASARGT